MKFVGVTPSASDLAGLGGLRLALVSGAALVVLVGLANPADAQRFGYGGYGGYGGLYAPTFSMHPRRSYSVGSARREASAKSEKAEVKKESGFGDIPKGPQQIVVNITRETVTFYANGVRVAQGPTSTGVPGHPTPQGVFSVIEKDRYHHSNIYSGAPMPYMQRITWSGVALHEGVVTGHPASHGCIRLTHDFAQKLWPTTKLGVRVIVSRHDVEPVEFQHAKLFVPKQKPAEPKVAMNATDGAAIKVAQAAPATASDAAPAIEPAAAGPKAAEKPVDSIPAPIVVEMIKPADDVKAAKAAAEPVTTDEPVKATGTVAPAQPAAAPAPIPPSELRKSVEAPAEAPKSTQVPSQLPSPVPAQVLPAAAQPAPADAAPADDFPKPALTDEPVKPAVTPPRTKSADQPVKLSGQVAVFVSRKEKKIFVRQNAVPLFEMPITFDEPDKPLGTHVFTAMEVTGNGAGIRWNLMTIPTDTVAMMEDHSSRRRSRDREPPKPVVQIQGKPASSAAEALDRVQFPQEAVDRISELLIPGSSLVISDTGLGHETGQRTEFIVLTR